MTNSSTILYRNTEGKAVPIELKTIQNLQVTDSSTIPSQSTIAGEYRNQFVSKAPLRVAFTVYLEDDPYGTFISVKEVLEQFVYLRDHRILFNLTTSHLDQDSKFLSDLAIEKFDWERDASRRNRLVVKVNCIQIKLIDLKWKAASSVEIFGTNIFENEGSGIIPKAFIPRTMQDFYISDTNFWTWAGDKLKFSANASTFGLAKDLGITSYDYDALVSGTKSLPLMIQVAGQLKDHITFDTNHVYFRLGDAIDLAAGSRKYTCKHVFQSRYNVADPKEVAYNVDFLTLSIETKQGSGTLVNEIPIELVIGHNNYEEYIKKVGIVLTGSALSGTMQASKRLSEDTSSNSNTTKFPYEFYDTYPVIGYVINDGFDSIVPLDGLSDFVIQHNDKLSSDNALLTNGNIITDTTKQYIQCYNTAQRYNFTAKYGENFTEYINPDGGLKVVRQPLTTSEHGLKPVIAGNYQSTWDNKFGGEYNIQIVFVMIGTKLQIFLFSDVFTPNTVNFS
jgi:hypothetical protein